MKAFLNPSRLAGVANMDEKDEMYDEAVRVVIETNQASVTILQRRLRLGYSRAARLDRYDGTKRDGRPLRGQQRQGHFGGP